MTVASAETTRTPARDQIEERFKWDLTALYPSDDDWRKDKRNLAGEIPGLDAHRGRLGDSAAALLAALDGAYGLRRRLGRLVSYASMRSDEDTRDSAARAMRQEIIQLANDLAARAAFLEPEILALERATVERFLDEEPRLAVYRHPLDDILRRQAHTGTAGEEKIIADAGRLATAPGDIHELLVDADLPHPEVTLSDGRRVALDGSSFHLYRALPDRDDRKSVFAAYFGNLHAYRRTLGATLYAAVERDLFYARARRYGSALESALDTAAIPVAVYHSLIDHVGENLATFHRYLGLRRRILEVDELHYYDLYAPLLPDVDLRYPAEEAQRHVLESLAPLGGEYQSVVERSFTERWLDFMPNEGKRSGAYSNGSAYDVHPYMLLNYNGTYNDVSTLTHELGHTMQSYLSNRDQPYPTADYPIFVAEVASTFNEALLVEHMLGSIDDDRARLMLLGNQLESFKATVVRQTQFAEFELAIHQRVERGESLTGDDLDAIYRGIVRRYYGHDAGVAVIDENVDSEWAFVPHFFYNFYVFQYATAFTASAALAERVLAGDATARTRYLEFLAAGGSDYPIALLARAGVDMTTAEPFTLTVAKMNRVMDEVETLLGRLGGATTA